MKFVIHDLKFGIAKAIFWGELREDGLHWAVSIQSEANSNLGFPFKPRAYSERLYGLDSTAPKTLRSWLNKELRWSDCYSEKIGDHNAVMYGFEHCDIYKSTLRMTLKADLKLNISWQGRCDLFIDDRYGRNLPFSIEADLAFAGISSRLEQPLKSREMLSHWITDADAYRFNLTESGTYLSGLVFESPKMRAEDKIDGLI